MATTTSNGRASNSNGGNMSNTPASTAAMVAHRFPVNSLQEITLQGGEVVSGRVYCSDETTGSVVIQAALAHTTLASELRILNVSSIKTSKELQESEAKQVVPATPLPKIQKKALEERERRARRLAEESLRHINQKASPTGQAVFDRLLKACGDVVWKDEHSILVLNQIQVDAPYQPENCKIITNGNGGALEDGSLDRVKKIVAHNETANSTL